MKHWPYKKCDLMRDEGREHCRHIEDGTPCCQCGYVRQISEHKDDRPGQTTLEEEIRVLRTQNAQLSDERDALLEVRAVCPVSYTELERQLSESNLRLSRMQAALTQAEQDSVELAKWKSIDSFYSLATVAFLQSLLRESVEECSALNLRLSQVQEALEDISREAIKCGNALVPTAAAKIAMKALKESVPVVEPAKEEK